ncbi:hypothetical protein GC176_18330 [bacterium]|nr:hypothetical protein [bacterium]
MWYDIVCLAVLIIAAWRGADRGAVWQLAVLGSVGLCVLFASQLSPHIEPHIPIQEPVRHWATLGVIYALMSLIAFLVARTVRGWLEKVKFTEYDRHWGAILGLIKGAIVVVVATCFIAVMFDGLRPIVHESITGRIVRSVVEQTSSMMPAKVAFGLTQALDPEAGKPQLPDFDALRLSL